MKPQDVISSSLIGIFLFLGICCFSSHVNGQGTRVVFPDDKTLMSVLNMTESELRNRQFSGFPGARDDSCSTFQGQSGRCIALVECPELINFINTNGLQSFDSVNFLRSRICRYLFNNVLLCCVEEVAPVFTNTVASAGGSNSEIIPSLLECGLSSVNRIVGGKNIPHGAHPWLVGIGVPQGANSFRVFCGGTLITRRHVLTAAHCFIPRRGFPSFTHVRLGDHSLSQNNERSPPVTLLIRSRKSPGYNPTSQLNDIELVTLERDIQFTSYITPACLPFDFRTKIFDNEQMLIVGWGDTLFRSNTGSDVPLAANITVWSKARCLQAYAQFPQLELGKTAICAGAAGKDACQGDSGGPMLYLDWEKNQRYYVLGIVSFGRDCGNDAFPGVYTFVPEYSDWIRTNL